MYWFWSVTTQIHRRKKSTTDQSEGRTQRQECGTSIPCSGHWVQKGAAYCSLLKLWLDATLCRNCLASERELLCGSWTLRRHSSKWSKYSAVKNSAMTLYLPVRWRGAQPGEGLGALRYRRFHEKVSESSTTFQMFSLPPTSAAASYHSARVYLQVQQWMGKGGDKDPDEWGWLRVRKRLEPIMTDLPPAPEALLNFVRCTCRHDGDPRRIAELRVVNARASAARTRRCCQQRSLTTLTKRVASLKWWSMCSYVHLYCTWMLPVLHAKRNQ